jgi:hypothetical protein
MDTLIDAILQSDALGLFALAAGLLLLVADLATAPRHGNAPAPPPTSAGRTIRGEHRQAA